MRDRRHTDRIIRIEGVRNFRDLGGLRGQDGRMVRKGLLFRGGRLENITPAGLEVFKALNITTILDMRTDAEAARHPDPEIEGVTVRMISVLDEADMNAPFRQVARSDNEEVALVRLLESGFSMSGVYAYFVEQEFAARGMAEAIRAILDQPEGEAVMWHCTGGKDRSGTLTLLVYTILGVDIEDILEDFEMSNDAFQDMIEQMRKLTASLTDDKRVMEEMESIAGVNRCNMQKAVDLMNEKYGSVAGYIRDGLGITDEESERIREKYLEKV